MAISYSLVLGPPTTVEQVVPALLQVAIEGGLLPPDTPPEEVTSDGVILRSGIWCRAGAAKPSSFPWPPPVEEDFGVVKSCWVAFRENGDFDRNRERDEMVWIAAGLLRRLPGDAVLHYENEIAWLVRKDGRLVASDRDVNWTPERLAMLPPPYERRKLRFSDVPDPDA